MKDKKVLLILVCTAVLVLMSVAFAAFSQTLEINGTGTISSTWKVELDTDTANTKCTVSSKDSANPTTCNVTALSTSALTANISWASPGDSATITARVKNGGTLNANASMSAKIGLTSAASSACTNTTATANYTQYAADGKTTSGTAKTLTATAQTIGPMKVLSHATYNYGIYTIVITYNASSTGAAGACTFTGTVTATQAA